MYKIIVVDNRDNNGAWYMPSINWAKEWSNGYEGAYIVIHQVVKDYAGRYTFQDNLYLAEIFAAAKSAGFRVGFVIKPDGVRMSYAKEFIDLADKRTKFGSGLLPAVMIESWPSPYSTHQIVGDFIGDYFDNYLLKPFGNIVLALSKNTADFMFQAGGDQEEILKFARLDGIRLWYLRWGKTAEQMNAEMLASPVKKKVWIAGVADNVNEANWEAPVPGPTGPTGPGPSGPETNPYLELADLHQRISDIFRILGGEQ
jgi:hypothetical protein